MPNFKVRTNASEERTVKAHGHREAASKYHAQIGEMPANWNGEITVTDEQGEERTYRVRQAA